MMPTATTVSIALVYFRGWTGTATRTELRILDDLNGPVLDVGCSPGRLVEALRDRAVKVLGIDAAPSAIAGARSRGRRVMQRSVFDPIPREGTWASVLLFDGNIGIGGDPDRLLARVRDLLAPDGCVIVELEPPGAAIESGLVEFEVATGMVGLFPWCWVRAEQIAGVARSSDLRVDDCRQIGDRWFAWLGRIY